MKRFTEFKPYRQGESEGRYVQYAVTGCGNDSDRKGDYTTGASVDRLAELEDKIEKGTLIELPCRVGDTLYTNWRWHGDYMRKKDAPYPIKVVFIGINNSEEMGGGLVNVVNEKGRMWQFSFNDIGKVVFLTREEAEKRLKELQNG